MTSPDAAAGPAPAVSLSKTAHPAEDVVSAAAEAPASTAVPRPGRGGRLAWLAAVVVLTAALAAVAVLLVVRSRAAEQTAAYYKPSSAPLTAARTAGKALFSYDYRTIDKDFADAAALTTGTFRKEYAQTTAGVVRPVAVENKAVVDATTAGEGLAQAEPGRVVALVFVNQVTTSTKVTGQKLDSSRVRMTLVERDGRWLVSKVEAL